MGINNTPKTILLEVDVSLRGLRIDQALSQYLEAEEPGEYSRSQITEAIRNGKCKVNQKFISKPSIKLQGNEKIEIEFIPNVTNVIPDENVQFSIIFEDEYILVISKPSGLVVHPAPSVKTATLIHGLYSKLSKSENAEFSGDPERLGLVHRLDRDTSGIMIIAKTMKAKRFLQSQLLPPRKMKRVYHAITYGQFKTRKGSTERYNPLNFLDEVELHVPIGRDPRNRTRYKVDFAGDLGKTRDSQGTFRLLKTTGDFNLVECRLETGRTHQIRVHLEYLGSKILGDRVYGPKLNVNDRTHKQFIESLNGQLLHAKTLSFYHPFTTEFLTFEAPYYEEFRTSLDVLGLV